MRQALYDYWTIYVEPTFSRRETDDGFIVLERPGIQIWVVIYADQPFDADELVHTHMDRYRPQNSELFEREQSDELVGSAFLVHENDGWTLKAITAAYGRLVKLDFCFGERCQLDSAIEIWNSLEQSYPQWIKMCGQTSPPLAELRECLERGWQVQESVFRLKEYGQTDAALAVLIEAVSNAESATVRKSACEALALIEKGDAVIALRGRLADDSVEVRAWAADALLKRGEAAETVVPAMIEGMQQPEPCLPQGEARIGEVCKYLCVPDRYHAARVLSSIGEAARPARKVLLEHQMDESGCVRIVVAEALKNCGEPIANILPPLFDGLTSQDMSARERMRIVEPLLGYSVPHQQLLPSLIQTISESSDYSAMSDAFNALSEIGPQAQSAAESIVQRIAREPDDSDIRLLGAQTLVDLRIKLDVAVPILLAVLEDENIDADTKAEIRDDLSRIN